MRARHEREVAQRNREAMKAAMRFATQVADEMGVRPDLYDPSPSAD